MERTILQNLIWNEDYARRVLPFLKDFYFQNLQDKVLFQEIEKFISKYNKVPSKTSLSVEIENRKDLTDEQFKSIQSNIESFEKEEIDDDWLLDTTEKFCKDRAIYNAIVDGIQIIEGKDKKRNPDALPSLLTEALGVSFDNRVGHDYIDDANERFDFLHKVEKRIPFDLEFFNKITKGDYHKRL